MSEGFGPEAIAVEHHIDDAWEHMFESISLSTVFEQTLEALEQAADEASHANWDGYGASKLDVLAFYNALRLLTALPTTTPIPDVGVDPDGEVSITWQLAPRNVFSVSVGPHGRLSYAGLFGASKAHGTEWLRTEIPQAVLDGIARVYSTDAS